MATQYDFGDQVNIPNELTLYEAEGLKTTLENKQIRIIESRRLRYASLNGQGIS